MEGISRKFSALDKARIDTLLATGASHRKVANCLGLDGELVRGYYRRNHQTHSADKTVVLLGVFCRYCAGRISQRRAGALFCCTSHRLAWWQAHPEQMERKAWQEFTCVGCGRVCRVYGRRVRKYCSHACYISCRFHNSQESAV